MLWLASYPSFSSSPTSRLMLSLFSSLSSSSSSSSSISTTVTTSRRTESLSCCFLFTAGDISAWSLISLLFTGDFLFTSLDNKLELRWWLTFWINGAECVWDWYFVVLDNLSLCEWGRDLLWWLTASLKFVLVCDLLYEADWSSAFPFNCDFFVVDFNSKLVWVSSSSSLSSIVIHCSLTHVPDLKSVCSIILVFSPLKDFGLGASWSSAEVTCLFLFLSSVWCNFNFDI